MMYERDRYLTAVADNISRICGKPLAIIATVAFLFAWTTTALIIHIPPIVLLIVNTAIITITLLMVLLLENAHKQDIHALKARVDALAAELQTISRPAATDGLDESELQQVRAILKRRADGDDDLHHVHRDRRPSLF